MKTQRFVWVFMSYTVRPMDLERESKSRCRKKSSPVKINIKIVSIETHLFVNYDLQMPREAKTNYASSVVSMDLISYFILFQSSKVVKEVGKCLTGFRFTIWNVSRCGMILQSITFAISH